VRPLAEIAVPVLANRWTWIASVGLFITMAQAWPRVAWVCVVAANLWGYFEGIARKRAEEAVRERLDVNRQRRTVDS